MTLPLAGDPVQASDITRPWVILKSGTESVASSITPQNDDDFFVTLSVGRWHVKLILVATGVAPVTTADLLVKWTNTGTMAAVRRVFAGGTTAGITVSTATMRIQSLALGTSVQYPVNASNWAHEEDLVVDVTVAGILQLQWAQAVSNATATNVTSASTMTITACESASPGQVL